MKGRSFFVFVIFFLITGLAFAAFKCLRPKNSQTKPATSEFSKSFEFWVAELHGRHEDAHCHESLEVALKIRILFPVGLAKALAQLPAENPASFKGTAAIDGRESSSGPGASEISINGVETAAVWKKGTSGGSLQIDLDAAENILPGSCNRGQKSSMDARRHLRMETLRFENNTLTGEWRAEGEPKAGGSFLLQWASGGDSPMEIQGPTDVSAIASSKNVTLSWKSFPGAESYRVRVFEDAKFIPDKITAVRESKSNSSVVTEVRQGSIYGFVVTALVNGLESPPSSPVIAKVTTSLRARLVRAGHAHACAIRLDDGVVCWGANVEGQVGDGSKTTWSLPVEVPQIHAQALKIEGDKTCAQLIGGGETCWGAQSGSATETGSPTYVDAQILKLENPEPDSRSAGSGFECAINQNKNVICWGDNSLGQLGNGSGSNSQIPQPVLF
jgi:hypothetical protein